MKSLPYSDRAMNIMRIGKRGATVKAQGIAHNGS